MDADTAPSEPVPLTEEELAVICNALCDSHDRMLYAKMVQAWNEAGRRRISRSPDASR